MLESGRGNKLLTGFVMMAIIALGQFLAQASTRLATMLAFVLNKSSLVIPEMKQIKKNWN